MKNSAIRKESGKIFMNPGKTNSEDRLNFVKFWAEYVKNHSDEEWSESQNVLINSQIKSARDKK